MTSSDIRDMIKSLGNEAECKVIYQDRKGGGRRGGGGGGRVVPKLFVGKSRG